MHERLHFRVIDENIIDCVRIFSASAGRRRSSNFAVKGRQFVNARQLRGDRETALLENEKVNILEFPRDPKRRR